MTYSKVRYASFGFLFAFIEKELVHSFFSLLPLVKKEKQDFFPRCMVVFFNAMQFRDTVISVHQVRI